jgi:hypothetical protein
MLLQVTPPVDNIQLLWTLGLAIIGGFFTILVVMVPLLISTRRQATQANDAVNHRHTRKDSDGNTPLKAYDQLLVTGVSVERIAVRVEELAGHMEDLMAWRVDFHSKWASLPEHLENGHLLAKTLDDIVHRLDAFPPPDELRSELKDIRLRLEGRPCLVDGFPTTN